MEREQNQERLTRYLLGTLSEPEQVAIETDYFADRETFEEVWAAENDLIDNYLRGKLSAGDRELFEQRFLSTPRGRQRLKASTVLLKSIAGAKSGGAKVAASMRSATPFRGRSGIFRPGVPKPRFAFAFLALIVVLLVSSWGLVETWRLRRQLLRYEAEQTAQMERQRELETQAAAGRERVAQLTQELARARDQLATLGAENVNAPSSTHQVSFVLISGLARAGGETPTLNLPRGTETVALRVNLDSNDYPSYSAVLRTAEGAEVWRRSAVKATALRGSPALVLRVPAASLVRNDYILRLTGITAAGAEDAGQYYFRVER